MKYNIYERLGKYRIRLHIMPLYITITFLSRLTFLVGVRISNSQKLIEWIYREIEGYNRPENHCEPIQHN